jgi:hypothetical protein
MKAPLALVVVAVASGLVFAAYDNAQLQLAVQGLFAFCGH